MDSSTDRHIGDIFKDRNIILRGADAATTQGYTQIPNFVLRMKEITSGDKMTFAMILSYDWQNEGCFPGQAKLAADILQRHVQLVLTDRSALTAGRDYGVLSARTWCLADLSAKQSMLLAGLGWGNMPFHMVEGDVERGRLKVIRPADFDPRVARLVMGCAYLTADRLGPGARWLVERLRAGPGPHLNATSMHAAQISGG